jgi:hypothetical protein
MPDVPVAETLFFMELVGYGDGEQYMLLKAASSF